MGLDAAFDHLVNISSSGLRVLTMGGDGARGHSPKARTEIPAHPVANLVDTVGAGDTFMASIFVWFQNHGIITCNHLNDLTTEQLQMMMAYAAKAAALNCQEQGCNPPLKEALLS